VAARALAATSARHRQCDAFGVLLRSNALIAAPILAAYMPVPISFKRTAILFVPAGARFFVLVQVIYYSALGATRQHPCSRSWCSI
jgi:hypothetical protein